MTLFCIFVIYQNFNPLTMAWSFWTSELWKFLAVSIIIQFFSILFYLKAWVLSFSGQKTKLIYLQYNHFYTYKHGRRWQNRQKWLCTVVYTVKKIQHIFLHIFWTNKDSLKIPTASNQGPWASPFAFKIFEKL